jgi:hypothetical protein
MRVEILRAVMISGESVSAGSFIEVDLATANLLMGLGKAAKAVDPEPAPGPAVMVEPEGEPAKPVRKARVAAPLAKD